MVSDPYTRGSHSKLGSASERNFLELQLFRGRKETIVPQTEPSLLRSAPCGLHEYISNLPNQEFGPP